MIHLSARLSWHDNGWDGCVCRQPHLNSSCIVQDNIRDSRDDEKERSHAGICMAALDGWTPPCSRDINTYSPQGFRFVHRDPLKRDFMQPVAEDIPPYTTLPAPDDPHDFRLPDFTIGYQGDTFYWEHLGMLNVPSYRLGWERKRRWYEERLEIPVVGDGADPAQSVEAGIYPLVITSRDDEVGGMDAQHIEQLARKYILLEDG